MKIALAMIVKGTDEEANHLKDCLNSVSEHVDKIFITRTNLPEEEPNAKVKEVAEFYGAEVSDFEWEYDFAKARNFNFSQVPEEYDFIFWLDADDRLRNGNLLRDAIKDNKADAYNLWYQYAFDENGRPIVTHQKSRIIKNDGSFKWRGRLHEDLMTDRQAQVYLIQGVDVLHLSNGGRFEVNRERNLEIALKQVEDEPNDPRSYWNLGSSYGAVEKWQEAIDAYNTFLDLSHSDKERYVAFLRVSQALWNMGKHGDAIEYAQRALGLFPDYPDAYHKLGFYHYNKQQFERAFKYFADGLRQQPPIHDLIVFNPREYDFEPIRMLALTAFELNRFQASFDYLTACLKIMPNNQEIKDLRDKVLEVLEVDKEINAKVESLRAIKDKKALKKELEALPDKYKQHPKVCHLRNINFVKEKSSGKDVAYVCNFTDHIWNPEVAEKEGVGGSEEAVIHLSRRWAEKGLNVTVYCNCGHEAKEYDGVTYAPFWSYNYRDKWDAVILWRHPLYADYEINTDNLVLDMHDVLSADEFTKPRLKRIDKIFVKTKAHRNLYPDIPDEKFVITPNGIDPDQFTGTKKEKGLVINTSSADRSLEAMVDIWPEVKKRVPDAKFEWAYGWGTFDVAHGHKKDVMEWKNELLRKASTLPDFKLLGKLNHQEVAKLYERGHVFAYPTEFFEIHCISAVKAQLAGAYPVTTDFAALNETVSHGTKIHSKKTKDDWCPPYKYNFALDPSRREEFIDKLVEALEQEPQKHGVWRKSILKKYDWDGIADIWYNSLICQKKEN